MGDPDIIICQFSRSLYSEGSTVAAFICLSQLSEESEKSSSCFVQAYGHIFADQRWTKSSIKLTDIFSQSTGCILDENLKNPYVGPQSNTTQSACLFLTQQEIFNISQLSSGFFVQFELCNNMLPSFRGLSVSIVYNISVTLTLNSSSKQFIFPFYLSATGNLTTNNNISVSTLSIMDAKSLSKEYRLQSFSLSHNIENDDDDLNIPTPVLNSQNSMAFYRIMCENGNVCNFLYSHKIYPNSPVVVRINFDEATAVFPVVNIRLLQTELRNDNSRVQEKVMDSASRNISHALQVNIELNLPSTQTNSFLSCIAQLQYTLEVEFLQESTGVVSSTQEPSSPPSWKFVVEIIPRPPIRSNKKELLACLSPSAFSIQQEI